ncbi:MAG: mechanosensitive ion channel [Bacteroidota bacterium]|nr:mechanosensitive ion channel [Bacteroidota bacterium]
MLSFLGIIISAGIALSSTTVLGNLIAGIMNNSMKRYRNGDLITVSEYQGRVTKRSMFHTEIQLEDSNFITIPNLYIATNPVKLTRKTNSVISSSVSLGYDVAREKIEAALKEAATLSGLKDPYVYITGLGDYSATYKIHGFLEDTNKFFSTSSRLNALVMDTLHQNGIEIVSPAFMNQRRVEDKKFVPKPVPVKKKAEEAVSPEELVFDEAIKSGKIEKKKDVLKEMAEKTGAMKEKLKEEKDSQEKERIKTSIEQLETMRDRIQKSIEEEENKKAKK